MSVDQYPTHFCQDAMSVDQYPTHFGQTHDYEAILDHESGYQHIEDAVVTFNSHAAHAVRAEALTICASARTFAETARPNICDRNSHGPMGRVILCAPTAYESVLSPVPLPPKSATPTVQEGSGAEPCFLNENFFSEYLESLLHPDVTAAMHEGFSADAWSAAQSRTNTPTSAETSDLEALRTYSRGATTTSQSPSTVR
jgi:hypothetical protein